MKTIKVGFTNAMYAAIDQQAREQGQTGQHSAHAAIVRRAVRYWLNKNGHSAAQLDRTDAEADADQRIAPMGDPGTRSGKSQETKEANRNEKPAD